MTKKKSPGYPLPMAFVIELADGVQIAAIGTKVVHVGYAGETNGAKSALSTRGALEQAMKQAYGGGKR